MELELLDLSARGVGLKTSQVMPQVGDSIMFYLEGSEGYPGTVRSTKGNFAGVEFDNELPAPVYERLLFKYACNSVDHAGSDEHA